MKPNRKILIYMNMFLLPLLPLALCFCAFFLPPQYEESFMGELKYKCNRLNKTDGNRIIFVGGSGAAFGIDCALVENAFPTRKAVNFGMYAALGTTVMLDLSEDDVREGDIVIVMPEQDPQTLSCHFNGEYMWQGADGAFHLLFQLNREHLRAMIGQFPYFATKKCAYVLSGQPPQPDAMYRRNSFNEYGDIDLSACSANIMPNGYDSNTPIRFDEAVLSDDFIKELNEYTDTLTRRGATVWYYFCPINKLAVANDADIDVYYDYLQSRLHCQIIGNPHDCIMESGWFYDTNFHLNNSGKIVYTRNLIRAIKAALGDSTPTRITLPQMPILGDSSNVDSVLHDDASNTGFDLHDDASNADSGLHGDGPNTGSDLHGDGLNADSDCFTWEIKDGAAVLTGLTAEGLTREELTVPANLDDCPVNRLPADIFAGNTVLRVVTIQENIRAIDDYAFSGCDTLETIRMLHVLPQHCLAGQHLLDGTNAILAVDADLQTQYLLNYTWSTYAERIRGE